MVSKNLKFRNQVQIYVRQSHKSLFIEFVALAKRDPNFKQDAQTEHGLTSIAIMKLITQYVARKNPEFFTNNEETNKDNDSETVPD